MRISMQGIIRSHISTLYNARTGKISTIDILLFYILPIPTGIFLGILAPSEAAQIPLTMVSILAGLSFGTVIFIFDLRMKLRDKWGPKDRVLANFDELFANLLYSVFIAVCIVTVALLPQVAFAVPVVRIVLFILCVHYVLTLLMCLKRLGLAFREVTR